MLHANPARMSDTLKFSPAENASPRTTAATPLRQIIIAKYTNMNQNSAQPAHESALNACRWWKDQRLSTGPTG